MLPDLVSLECFETAAVQLNFRAAAEIVHLSPAAFGERIRRLEEELGATLFERTTRAVRLSDAGQRLLPQARRTLAEARRCRDAAASTAELAYELMLGTRFELGMSWLVPNLDRLSKAAPARQLNLYFGDTADLLGRARRAQLDCFVSSARLGRAELDSAPLHEERYVLVAARKLAKARPFARPADAARHVLVDAHADLPLFRYFLDAMPPSASFDFERVELLGAIGAIRLRVLAGAGIAVLPRYFVKDDLAKGRLVRLMPKVEPSRDQFRLVWVRGHRDAARIGQLAAELRSLPLS